MLAGNPYFLTPNYSLGEKKTYFLTRVKEYVIEPRRNTYLLPIKVPDSETDYSLNPV